VRSTSIIRAVYGAVFIGYAREIEDILGAKDLLLTGEAALKSVYGPAQHHGRALRPDFLEGDSQFRCKSATARRRDTTRTQAPRRCLNA
jgi:hypothetical protein